MTEKTFMDEIATLPTTNFRIFVSICLAVVYFIVYMVGLLLGKITDANTYASLGIGVFLLTMMGLDVMQFWAKRATFDPAALGQTKEAIDPAPPQPAAVEAHGDVPAVI